VTAHVVALAREPNPTGFDEVSDGGKGFAFVAAAAIDELDEFAKVVNRPLDF